MSPLPKIRPDHEMYDFKSFEKNFDFNSVIPHINSTLFKKKTKEKN